MMSRTAKILRNSLILLAFGATVPAAWAMDAPPASTQFNVPVHPADSPPTPRILDLKAPDVRDVMTPDEMASALAVPDEFDVLAPETVAVQGDTYSPYVPSGFGALYWAALHPFSAWRILAPAQ
jgi:hypothetical protein